MIHTSSLQHRCTLVVFELGLHPPISDSKCLFESFKLLFWTINSLGYLIYDSQTKKSNQVLLKIMLVHPPCWVSWVLRYSTASESTQDSCFPFWSLVSGAGGVERTYDNGRQTDVKLTSNWRKLLFGGSPLEPIRRNNSRC